MSELHWTSLISRRFDSPNQAFVTHWLSQRMGSVVAAVAHRLRMTPNAVTVCGLIIMLLGCVVYAAGTDPAAWLAAALIWQFGFAFDCADGQLARATGQSGPLGAWLDVACDYVRISAMITALLVVFIRAGLPEPAYVIAVFCLLIGLFVYLHTATFMKVEQPQELAVSGTGSLVRQIVRNALDTPIFLALLCLLRTLPWVLLLFCIGYGLLSLMRGAAIGYTRLDG